MKNLKKTGAVLLTAVLLFLFLFVGCPEIVADAASVRTKKIVSVVYDDSGSMSGAKVYYTSYAMQCFAGMLNKEDILEVTYMNGGQKTFDTSARQKTVDFIRQNASCKGGTPLSSIDTAFRALKSHSNTDKNTQYWLVIVTDGAFHNGTADDEDPAKSLQNTKKKVSECASQTMPNGTSPRIVFFSICDTSNMYTPSFSEPNIDVKTAETADDIINQISSIACEISGRFEVDKKDIDIVDGRTVKVTADVPLTNIGVLTQKSDAVVKRVNYEGSADKTVESNVSVYIDSNAPITDAASLSGNIAIINDGNNNLPAGEYTIEFSEDISADDMVIMFEPAFELRIEVFSGGKPVTDTSLLSVGNEIDVTATLYETGTDNKILSSMLPKGTTYKMSRYEDGNNAGDVDGFELNDIMLKKAENKIVATVDLPGYFTLEAVEIFTPLNIELSDLKADIHFDGSERRVNKDGTVDAENVVYITDLDKNGTGIKYTLYIEDKPITKEQAEGLLGDFEKSLEADFRNFTTAINDDGTIVVYPTKTWIPSLIYWMLHHGDSTIKSEYSTKSAAGTINFKIGDLKAAVIELLIVLLVIAAILYLIIMIFFKKRFRNAVVCAKNAYSSGSSKPEYSGASMFTVNKLSASGPINFFFGLRAKKKIPGTPYRLVAGDNGEFMIENIKHCRVSSTKVFPGNGCPESTEKRCSFTNNIYINNGGSYTYINVQ